ncbi:MAG: hypothetical protein ACREHD_05945 [Pirellulales bacterium]
MNRLCERSRQRLNCLIHGHRDLSGPPVYAEITPGGASEKELHYCGACGGPVWAAVPHQAMGPPTWASTGLTNP